MGIYASMPNDMLDARVLLEVAPDQYVTERTRLVKQARADRDKDRASFYQSLKRPPVALWAALVASDADVVQSILDVTTELGTTQAGGSNASSLAAATKRRRTTLEGFVDRAVNALSIFDTAADKRRPEIRALVDQLSRHPELADAWIDGTLRDLPDEQFGFGAFSDVVLPVREQNPAPPKATTKALRRAAEPPEEVRDLAAERAARAERREQARVATKDVAEAARELTVADRKVTAARASLKEAEKELQLAQDQRATAERRHERAVAHHDSLH